MTKNMIRRTVLTAVFTALIAASSFFTIPVGPVPIVLTTMFVVLSGMLGGVWVGFYSVLTYLLLGAIGLPVFAGGTAGLAKILGPTGGFLIGYPLAALIGGLMFNPRKDSRRLELILLSITVALTAGLSLYIPGLPWLKYNLALDWPSAFKVGLIPFIPGLLIKTAGAVVLAVSLKERFHSFLTAEEE